MAALTGGWRARLTRPALQSIVLAAALVAILTFQVLPGGVNLNVGEVAPRTIKSPRKITFVSRILTDAERERAVAGVPDVLDYDPSILGVQYSRLRDTLNRIEEIRRSAGSLEQKAEAIAKIPDLKLSAEAIEYVLQFDDLSMRAAEAEALRLLDDVERGRLSARDVAQAGETLRDRVSQTLIPAEQALAIELARAYLRPNMAINEPATTRLRREARDAIKPIEVTVEQGETILRDGEIVKPTDIEKLSAVGLRSADFDWIGFTGQAMLVAVLVALISVYVRIFLPKVWASPRKIALLYLLVIAAAAVTKLIVPGRPVYVYALPLATVPMLLTVLVDARAAWVSTVLLAIFLGLVGANPLELVTLMIVGGTTGVLGVWRSDRVNRFIAAGAMVSVANLAVVLSFRLIDHAVYAQDLLFVSLLCLANGFLAAIVTLGTVTVLGHLFGLTTTLGLLELAHPTQPLFQRLLQEAPGTYHHSMMIANLSERAAQAVGADALLCRVSAYYHDIGKILRPYFYVENQLDMPNIHDRLDPATSARIIASHVTDGIKLAEEYGLPAPVIDLIAQHHGTRFIGAFYFQARKASPDNPPPEEEFRYVGPRPQSKEAAILMLADGVEAAVRASKDHSPERIEAIVTKIISDRVQEGELEDCDLTLRDLSVIKQALLTVLHGVFHPRIDYPDNVRPPADVPGAAGPPAPDAGAPVGSPAGGPPPIAAASLASPEVVASSLPQPPAATLPGAGDSRA